MSVGGVTWRTLRGDRSATRVRTIYKFLPELELRPRQAISLRVKPFRDLRSFGDRSIVPRSQFQAGFQGRISTPLGQKLSRQVERRALRKLAFKLLRSKAFGVADELIRDVSWMIWQQTLDPTGFPGWGNFPAEWTSHAGVPQPKSPGSYTSNGFDTNPTWVQTSSDGLIDKSDGSPIFGFRYWGHFHGSNPLPGGRPGDDWATTALTMAMPKAQALARSATAYRQLANLWPEPVTQVMWVRNNISIRFGTTLRDPIDIKVDVARIRDRQNKAKPADAFVYAVLRSFADGVGEIREWVDILSEAAGYEKYDKRIPKALWGNETQKKMFYLFALGGFNNIDFDDLALLVVENEIEDAFYGFLGTLSKSAARRLGMTVGPQTGLVM